jgi:hypothetical protein
MNDQTAQMGFQVGQTALKHGQEYVEQNVRMSPTVSFQELIQHSLIDISMFRPSSTTSTSQIRMLLTNCSWCSSHGDISHGLGSKLSDRVAKRDGFSPQERIRIVQTCISLVRPNHSDINTFANTFAVMAFVTYILLSTVLAGLRGAFQPELLGYTATTAFAIVIFEILGLKLGCYLLSISNESQVLDLLAYSGYKFVGIIVTLIVSEIINRGQGTGGWAGWTIFGYTFLANAFFLVSRLQEDDCTSDRITVTLSQIRPTS